MKKLLLFVVFTALTVCSFSQASDNTVKPMLKADYLKKSKNQKTAAWVTLGVGIALDVAGIATTISNATKETGNIFGNNTSVSHGGEYALYITGTVALATSLTLFIAAKRNKTRAASLSFKNEMAPQLQNSTVSYKAVPSVSLKLNF